MAQDQTTLSEEHRAKLDGIVNQMVSNGEPEENIQWVVNDFKSKYSGNESAEEPAAESESGLDWDKINRVSSGEENDYAKALRADLEGTVDDDGKRMWTDKQINEHIAKDPDAKEGLTKEEHNARAEVVRKALNSVANTGGLGAIPEWMVESAAGVATSLAGWFSGNSKFIQEAAFLMDPEIKKQLAEDPSKRQELWEEYSRFSQDADEIVKSLGWSQTQYDHSSPTEAFEAGEIKQGAQLFSQQLAQGVGSLIPLVIPGGVATLGTSAAGSAFDEDIKNRPDESLEKIAIASIEKGGVEFVTELVTNKLIKGTGLALATGKGAKAVGNYTASAFSKWWKGAASEGLAEGSADTANRVLDYLNYGDEIDAREAVVGFIDSAMIGAAIGGGLGSIQNHQPSSVEQAMAAEAVKTEPIREIIDEKAQKIQENQEIIKRAESKEEGSFLTEVLNKENAALAQEIDDIQRDHVAIMQGATKAELKEIAESGDAIKKLKRKRDKMKKKDPNDPLISEVNSKIDSFSEAQQQVYGKVKTAPQVEAKAQEVGKQIDLAIEEKQAQIDDLFNKENKTKADSVKAKQLRKEIFDLQENKGEMMKTIVRDGSGLQKLQKVKAVKGTPNEKLQALEHNNKVYQDILTNKDSSKIDRDRAAAGLIKQNEGKINQVVNSIWSKKSGTNVQGALTKADLKAQLQNELLNRAKNWDPAKGQFLNAHLFGTLKNPTLTKKGYNIIQNADAQIRKKRTLDDKIKKENKEDLDNLKEMFDEGILTQDQYLEEVKHVNSQYNDRLTSIDTQVSEEASAAFEEEIVEAVDAGNQIDASKALLEKALGITPEDSKTITDDLAKAMADGKLETLANDKKFRRQLQGLSPIVTDKVNALVGSRGVDTLLDNWDSAFAMVPQDVKKQAFDGIMADGKPDLTMVQDYFGDPKEGKRRRLKLKKTLQESVTDQYVDGAFQTSPEYQASWFGFGKDVRDTSGRKGRRALQSLLERLNKVWGNDVPVYTDRESIRNALKAINQDPNDADRLHGMYVPALQAVFINPASPEGIDTAIHEYGHVWQRIIRLKNPKLWEHGARLLQNSPYENQLYAEVKADPQSPYRRFFNSDLTSLVDAEGWYDEVMAQAIGKRGQELFLHVDKQNAWDTWMKKIGDYLKSKLGIRTDKDFNDITLNDFIDGAVTEIITGAPVISSLNISTKYENPYALTPEEQAIEDKHYDEKEYLQGKDLPAHIEEKNDKSSKNFHKFVDAIVAQSADHIFQAYKDYWIEMDFKGQTPLTPFEWWGNPDNAGQGSGKGGDAYMHQIWFLQGEFSESFAGKRGEDHRTDFIVQQHKKAFELAQERIENALREDTPDEPVFTLSEQFDDIWGDTKKTKLYDISKGLFDAWDEKGGGTTIAEFINQNEKVILRQIIEGYDLDPDIDADWDYAVDLYNKIRKIAKVSALDYNEVNTGLNVPQAKSYTDLRPEPFKNRPEPVGETKGKKMESSPFESGKLNTQKIASNFQINEGVLDVFFRTRTAYAPERKTLTAVSNFISTLPADIRKTIANSFMQNIRGSGKWGDRMQSSLLGLNNPEAWKRFLEANPELSELNKIVEGAKLNEIGDETVMDAKPAKDLVRSLVNYYNKQDGEAEQFDIGKRERSGTLDKNSDTSKESYELKKKSILGIIQAVAALDKGEIMGYNPIEKILFGMLDRSQTSIAKSAATVIGQVPDGNYLEHLWPTNDFLNTALTLEKQGLLEENIDNLMEQYIQVNIPTSVQKVLDGGDLKLKQNMTPGWDPLADPYQGKIPGSFQRFFNERFLVDPFSITLLKDGKEVNVGEQLGLSQDLRNKFEANKELGLKDGRALAQLLYPQMQAELTKNKNRGFGTKPEVNFRYASSVNNVSDIVRNEDGSIEFKDGGRSKKLLAPDAPLTGEQKLAIQLGLDGATEADIRQDRADKLTEFNEDFPAARKPGPLTPEEIKEVENMIAFQEKMDHVSWTEEALDLMGQYYKEGHDVAKFQQEHNITPDEIKEAEKMIKFSEAVSHVSWDEKGIDLLNRYYEWKAGLDPAEQARVGLDEDTLIAIDIISSPDSGLDQAIKAGRRNVGDSPGLMAMIDDFGGDKQTVIERLQLVMDERWANKRGFGELPEAFMKMAKNVESNNKEVENKVLKTLNTPVNDPKLQRRMEATKQDFDLRKDSLTYDQMNQLNDLLLKEIAKDAKKDSKKSDNKKKVEELVKETSQLDSGDPTKLTVNQIKAINNGRNQWLKDLSKGKFLTVLANTLSPASNNDFYGLLYNLLPQGKTRNEAKKWIEDTITKPLEQANIQHLAMKSDMIRSWKAIKTQAGVTDTLINAPSSVALPIPGKKPLVLSNSQVIKVYNYMKDPSLQNQLIEGGFDPNIQRIVKQYVENNVNLKTYADLIPTVYAQYAQKINDKLEAHGLPPITIHKDYTPLTVEGQGQSDIDLISSLDGKDGHHMYTVMSGRLRERTGGGAIDVFNSNLDTDMESYLEGPIRTLAFLDFAKTAGDIFGPKQLQAMTAAYGKNWTDALKDSLRRIVSGKNQPAKQTPGTKLLDSWIRNTVGNVMFFNIRSGLLQHISIANFMAEDPGLTVKGLRADKATKKKVKDFIKSSDWIKNRKDGKTELLLDEMFDQKATGKVGKFYQNMQKKGYSITKMGDINAIIQGGGPYMTGLYLKNIEAGMDPDTAMQEAFDAFTAKAEETQQSTKPERLGKEQTTRTGKLLLAFANTPMQYNRKMSRALKDFVAPGSTPAQKKAAMRTLIYYGGLQNATFTALQKLSFLAMGIGGDDDDKVGPSDFANGVFDTILRGIGVWGALAASIKNALIAAANDKDVIKPLIAVSPAIGTKVRHIENTIKDKPAYPKSDGLFVATDEMYRVASAGNAILNLPTDRVLALIEQANDLFAQDLNFIQKMARLGGWSRWDLKENIGADEKYGDTVKRRAGIKNRK